MIAAKRHIRLTNLVGKRFDIPVESIQSVETLFFESRSWVQVCHKPGVIAPVFFWAKESAREVRQLILEAEGESV